MMLRDTNSYSSWRELIFRRDLGGEKKTGKKVEMKVNSPTKLNRWRAMFFKVQRTNSRHTSTD